MKTISIALLLTSASFPALAQPLAPDRRDTPALSTAPASQPATPAAQADAPANPAISLTRVVVDGVRPSAALDAVWRPFVGRPMDAATLRATADAVAAALREDGLALYTVRIPAQTFDGGVLRLAVTQGFIEEVVFHGETSGDMDLARAYGEALTQERPLSRRTLERYISLIRDIPGLTADIQMLQGAQAGGVKLAVGMTRTRSEVAYTLHTRTQPLLGGQALQADWYVNGLMRQGDQTIVTGAVSGDFDRYQRLALSHSTPLGADGLRLQGSLGWAKTRPDGLPIEGTVKSASLQLSYPLIRSYQTNLILSLGLDGLDSDSAVFGQTLATEAPRTGRLAATWTRDRPTSSTAVSAALARGIDGLGANVNPLFADVEFEKANLAFGYNRKLGPAHVLRLRAMVQASDDALPTSEQMALGGAPYGRAFDTALLLADEGRAVSGELAWIRQAPITGFTLAEAFVFADAGDLSRNPRPALAAASDHLSSAGIGVRVAFGPKLQIGIEAAQPIDRPIGVGNAIKWGFSLAGKY